MYGAFARQRARLDKALAKQEAKLLARHQERTASKAAEPVDLDGIDWQLEEKRLLADLEPVLKSLLEGAAAQWAAQYGTLGTAVSWDLFNEAAAAYAQSYTYDLVTLLNDSTRQQMGQVIGRWIESPATFDDLTERIWKLVPANPYPNMRDRAQVIAATETTRIYADTQREALTAAGLERWTWNTSADEIVCDRCGPLNGVTASIEEGFTDPVTGDKLSGPPAHPACRCWAVASVDELEEAVNIRTPQSVANESPPSGRYDQMPSGAKIVAAEDVDLAPNGTKIGDSIGVTGSGGSADKYKEALAAIDSVHGDGSLPNLSVEKTFTRTSWAGKYRYDGASAVDIQMCVLHGDSAQSVMVHEIGHVLDHQVIGARGVFASTIDDGVLAPWWKAVESSKAYNGLLERRIAPKKFAVSVDIDGRIIKVKPDIKELDYYLDRRELWARSYAQYIAERSGNTSLLEQLSDEMNNSLYGNSQWSSDDFKPIAAAIDQIFRGLGWLR